MLPINYGLAWTALSLVNLYNYFHTQGFVHVKTDKGVLRGRNTSAWTGASYFAFKGIPYARPPIGHLRFKGPREDSSWDGVRDAIDHGSVCPHVDIVFNVLMGNENCLFLNVYTPSLGGDGLPVIVWIHGGRFQFSSGNDDLWSPDYFLKAGVVLVTINYRQGPLGFLSTEDDEAPGNAGLKDQVAALKWVKRNIASFGGDPKRVTIFGASTGAASVQYLLLSPMASGLFAGAIAHSGSPLNPWALMENGPSIAIRMAQALGAKGLHGDKSKAVKFLKTASYQDIVRIQEAVMTPAERRSILFAPSIEKNVESEETFLPDSPVNIFKSGNFNKVPLITGYAKFEGNLYESELKKPETLRAVFEHPERYVPKDIKSERVREELAESIRGFYFKDKPIGDKNISNLVDFYSDTAFSTGVRRSARLQLRSGNSCAIYFFVFSYDGDLNLTKYVLAIKSAGATHVDELGYLFYQKLLFWRKPGLRSEDEHVSKTMIRLWTNFAKFGNPTPPGDPVSWKPATLEEFNFLNISGYDTKLDVNPDPERTEFWEKAYERDAASGHSNYKTK